MRPPSRNGPSVLAMLAGMSVSGCGIVTSATPTVGPDYRGDPALGEPFQPQVGQPSSDGSTVSAVSGALWDLVAAQDHYHALNRTYARSLSALEKAVDFSPGGASRIRLFDATESGYSAVARRGNVECAVFVGSAPPPRDYATADGQVECNQPYL